MPALEPMPSRPHRTSGSARRRHPLTALLTALLTLFLVLFPKGGVKFANVPLTWGYFLLGITFPVLAIVRLLAFPLRAGRGALLAVASLVPFQIIFLYSVEQNGVVGFGEALSTIASFVILPLVFLLIYPAFLHLLDGVRFDRLFRFCIFSAAAFGIFLFFLYPLTGHLFEIPYLTVNADDYGLIESTKHINRGAYLKLISTYNNGNVYGVATLILLPLYDTLEPRLWRRNLVKLALILSLSRTVWFGLIAEQLLSLFSLSVGAARTFPRVVLGSAVKRGAVILLTVGGVLIGLTFISRDVSFLFDSQLGGRAGTVRAAVDHLTWLPAIPVQLFGEVVYATALTTYGIAGLLSILLIFTLPIVLVVLDQRSLQSPLRRAALKGMLLYMILMCIDGAINFIPVMAFYWFVYMIFLHGWPGDRQTEAHPSSRAHSLGIPATLPHQV